MSADRFLSDSREPCDLMKMPLKLKILSTGALEAGMESIESAGGYSFFAGTTDSSFDAQDRFARWSYCFCNVIN